MRESVVILIYHFNHNRPFPPSSCRFNAIRHIATENSDVNFLHRFFEKAFSNADINKTETFVNLIQYQE